MAKKKITKDTDIAAGFFSQPNSASNDSNDLNEKITAPIVSDSVNVPSPKKKNKGGRPKKEGLKKAPFTVIMHPERYEQIRLISEIQGKSISNVISDAIQVYCNTQNIDLNELKVDSKVLEFYHQKQNKKL